MKNSIPRSSQPSQSQRPKPGYGKATPKKKDPYITGYKFSQPRREHFQYGYLTPFIEPDNLPPSPFKSGNAVFNDATLRQTLHMSLAFDRVRLQISNTFGGTDLTITAASLALPRTDKAGVNNIHIETLKPLTFSNGSPSITIPKGKTAYTDPLDFYHIAAQSTLSVSLYLKNGQSVVNQAAGGNAVLSGGLGPTLLSRYTRDGITQQGVKYLMIFEGVNDIGGSSTDASTQSSIGDRLISAFKQITSDAHKAGLITIGATITPFGGSGQSYSNPEREKTRVKVNKWILNSGGAFDKVVDFAAAVGNPGNVAQLANKYDGGDHLHPNVDGYITMANAFDMSIFK
ncbi:hypothetical protein M7I_2027 [Glarea lozoyensis 74030]|uniref:SGNH hydrolase-type esterase domain-containing protein n=1 Tax=Glarea lozoyensis (strain ATCC 74030 / MF5533) TaxID=1104152 RepID=H0EHP3_GLAL7|nr:hypothetical protein M7I_2027 [Glarea lozoyensis 74030]